MKLPSAIDEAGLKMLDSIREIFDILDLGIESIRINLIEYTNFEQLSDAIHNSKCPVVDVLNKYLYGQEKNGSHVMVATGLKNKNGVKCIELKNSYADNPNEQGKV